MCLIPHLTVTVVFKTALKWSQALSVSFVSCSTGKVSPELEFPDLKCASKLPGGLYKISADLELYPDFGYPGATLLTITPQCQPEEVFVVSVTAKGFKLWKSLQVTIPCYEWISYTVKNRVFFGGLPALPKQTPNGILSLRERELSIMQKDDGATRSGDDRVYDYAAYNDLRNKVMKIPLGGSKDRCFPRRLRTGRPLNPDGKTESRPINPVTGDVVPFWVPRDDDFSAAKLIGITTRKQKFAQQAKIALEALGGAAIASFKDFPSIKIMYSTASGGAGFPVPRVFNGREDAWKSDVEFGRQRIAGMHPTFIEAITSLPKTSGITDLDVKPILLDGASLELRLSQGRMYLIDYTTVMLDLIDKINSQKGPFPRFQYAPRCLLYLNDLKQLVPVAIELLLPTNKSTAKEVYTPKDTLTEWICAKAHFTNVDTLVHQTYTLYTRSNACTEPYVIATRRHLSALHPVYRILIPHFADTLRANATARACVVSEGGILEGLLTAGGFIDEVMASFYQKHWRFTTEGLPADLIKRNMATGCACKKEGWRSGKVELTLKEYPYAEDGLLLWQAMYKWVFNTLVIYYHSVADVAGDNELQAWWDDIKTKGHPDIVGFGFATEQEMWPPLVTVDDLAYILVTIIWVASGHHSAVRFGQYDYMGYMPNMPTFMCAPMPSLSDIKVAANVLDEKILLNLFPAPSIAISGAAFFESLSTLCVGNVLLGIQIPSWLVDRVAARVFGQFSVDVSNAGKAIDKKNKDTSLVSRKYPYTLLQPSLKGNDKAPVLDSQGITNSVSL